MKKITLKLIILFITLMCVSSFLSFLISTLFSSSIKNELVLNQKSISNSVLELREKTDLTVEDIVIITSTKMYDVKIVENINSLSLTDSELNRVHNKEVIHIFRNKFHGASTIFMIEDKIIQISLHPNNTIFKIVASRVWFGIITYIAIGALLITILGNRLLKPLLRLNSATHEVAKGNFDIQVENNSKDEIGQLTKNFNKMIRELKSIEYLRKDFISSVSHEFKTPIASIQGFAKLLQKENISEEEKQEYTNIIVEETARLSNLSSNILKLSKLENQEIVEKSITFSLDEQIRKSVLLLEPQWSKKNIELDIELQKVDYTGDEELMQQVWINLINNAIKFSKENGKIEISLTKADERIKVTIRDFGIGMTKETIERIFEKFYQGEEAHSYEGNGLGLPLVKRILDLSGGRIEVESKLGEGSNFTVEL